MAENEMTDAIQNVAAFPLYAIGWLAGGIMRGLSWFKAAIILGYTDGRGL